MLQLEEDIENYMYLKTMKSGRIKIKPGVLPHIFNCQETRTTTHSFEPQKTLENGQQITMIKINLEQSTDANETTE